MAPPMTFPDPQNCFVSDDMVKSTPPGVSRSTLAKPATCFCFFVVVVVGNVVVDVVVVVVVVVVVAVVLVLVVVVG